ncbi:MAG TPA: recombination mediator RecR [Opitutaceae bacterium]
MTPAFDNLVQRLRKLPGIGFRSAERIALHLLVERPGALPELSEALETAARNVRRCAICGNLAEEERCAVCSDASRDATRVCVIEHVQDLVALERSGSYRGTYHVLHGKLSPIRGIGPDELNIESLRARLDSGGIAEVILALSNDVEGEATCHFLSDQLAGRGITLTRIGFGLPSGGGVLFADSTTLKSALDARRPYL